MRVNRTYFFLVFILSLVVIYSCFDKDQQINSGKEKVHAESQKNTLHTEIRAEASKDTFIFNINSSLSDFIFILSIEPLLIDTLREIREIAVYTSIDSQLIQNISLEILSQRPPGYDFFFVKDFNFDGFKDLVLMEEFSGTGNISYCVWLYNKSKKIFETDNFFKSIDRPILDERKKQITTYVEFGGFDEYYNTTYKLKNGKFILLYELKYWRDYKEKSYLQMKDSSIGYKDTLILISRIKYGP